MSTDYSSRSCEFTIDTHLHVCAEPAVAVLDAGLAYCARHANIVQDAGLTLAPHCAKGTMEPNTCAIEAVRDEPATAGTDAR